MQALQAPSETLLFLEYAKYLVEDIQISSEDIRYLLKIVTYFSALIALMISY